MPKVHASPHQFIIWVGDMQKRNRWYTFLINSLVCMINNFSFKMHLDCVDHIINLKLNHNYLIIKDQ